MTREQAKEMVPIIQAYAEGKTVQLRGARPMTAWVEASEKDMDLIANCSNAEWRIKPDPRQGWVPTYAICASPEAAIILAKSMCGSPVGDRCEIIPVIEAMK